ncbi:hypothetical protein QUW40_06140 [Collinsella tanakaei]|uniref:hypothetical protein n=1 Tax=Collinsella tanakaei TaxID=626935 RepID=UPI0025A3AAB9|nr:hypothetical protein [Collinsella tanakaei]MDM8246178.1 hypothetical protein [Collinsella tanakaei]
MEKNRMGLIKHLKTLMSVFTVAVVAMVGLAVAPQNAQAEIVHGYENTPYSDITVGPGFKWVPATDTEPGYYLVFDPIHDPELIDPAHHEDHYQEDCAGWYYFVEASRKHDFKGYLIKLNSDIDFTAYDYNRNPNAGRTQLTVGSEDVPFAGTFDGQNYVISNLNNERGELGHSLAIVIDCGFFGQTDGATIKNVNFEDCYVGASYRGGVLVGYAKCTLIENVTLTRCTSSIIPANNVINLVTNAGISGGILAGETVSSTLYDCEVKNGSATCNATIGVGALGGQPLYLGAMVGFSTNSVIEYCRVTAETDPETGQILPESDSDDTGGRTNVSMHYDTAVGAVAASEVYTGGLVGGANTTKDAQDAGTPSQIIDCFSTADIDSFAGCYISVGAGTAGYVGGIVGRTGQSVDVAGSVNPVHVTRCSFAGDMSSRQINSILVLPVIIEDNKFLAAIVGRDGDNAVVQDCYYNEDMASASIDGKTDKIVAIQDGTLASDNVTYGDSFGPMADQFESVDFWESCGFDFGGSVVRTTNYPKCNNGQPIVPQTVSQLADGEGHSNKWVMDYNIGIPVHGGNLMATFDFPGAGTVEIGKTKLDVNHAGAVEGVNAAWKTDNPYDFAQQGFQYNDNEITLTYEEGKNPALGDVQSEENQGGNNTGWRVEGWYRQQGVGVTNVGENHDVFTEDDGVLTDNGHIIGNEEKLFKESGGASSEGKNSITLKNDVQGEGVEDNDFVDGDLYVAYLKANVIYHDVDGNMLNIEGKKQDKVDDEKDWYDYGKTFKLLEQVGEDAAEPGSADARLIGWTTEPKNGEGYPSISTTELNTLKQNGTFYEIGDSFEVLAPANLYPVYADQISNVEVIYEGHERIASGTQDREDIRQQFGQAVVKSDLTTGDIYVAVVPEDNGKLESGAVRFLGWYENVAAEGELENWVRVDKGEQLELNDTDGSYVTAPEFFDGIDGDTKDEYFKFNLTEAEVDLNTKHTYMARFEYRVDYHYTTGSSDFYAHDWSQYSSQFNNYTDLSHSQAYDDKDFLGWWTGADCSSMIGDAVESIAHQKLDDDSIVNYPMEVHGHWEEADQDDGGPIRIGFDTDFPGSATLQSDYRSPNMYVVADPINDGFNLYFWSESRSDGETYAIDRDESYQSSEYNAGSGWNTTSYKYWVEAHMTADVVFELPEDNKAGVEEMPFERRYRQLIFDPAGEDSSITHEIKYHYNESVTAGTIKMGSTLSSTTTGVGENDPKNYEVNVYGQTCAPDGYAFAGWIDASAVKYGDMTQEEWNYVFDGGNDLSNGIKSVKYISRVVPYLIDEDTLVCTRPMTLHPVYVPIDIETTTNIRNADVPDGYNMPALPGVENMTKDAPDYYRADIEFTPSDFASDESFVGQKDGEHKGEFALTYDRKGNAVIKVTADDNAYLEGSEGDKYSLVSVTMSVDGGEEVILTSDQDTKTEFTVDISLGHSYVFTANYKPVPVEVVYHLHGGEDEEGSPATDVKKCEVGDLLPTTSYSPSYEVPNGFFVGWTEGDEDTSNYVTWNEDVKLVNPGKDTVTHSMHLWPVYRTATITVQSNIDNVVESSPATMGTMAGDAQGLYLNAATVSGYEFVGWTKGASYPSADGGSDAFENFEPISTSQTYRLSGDARFESVTYTAVYRSAYTVVYHGLKDDVLYTQNLTAGQALSYETEVSDDGTKGWAIRDPQPFTLINAAIAASNAAEDAAHQVQFVSWALVDTEGKVAEWEDKDDNFSRTAIDELVPTGSKQIDLYPVTYQFSAKDAKDANFSSDLFWSLSVDEEDSNKISASIQLKDEYEQAHLKVHVDKVVHKDGIDPTPQANVPVTLYGPGGSGGLSLGTSLTQEKAATVDGVELQAGDALFTFKGYLSITKASSDAMAAGRTFTFTVKEEGTSDSRKVNITLPADAADGAYTKTVLVELPYGTYTVSEDDGWAWRFDATTQTWDGDKWTGSGNSASVDVEYLGVTVGADGENTFVPTRVQTTNALANDKWLDGDASAHNVFGGTTTAGSGEGDEN